MLIFGLSLPQCSGVGFVDRGSTSGHNVMFFTWNDARKKIAAFTVELRVCVVITK